jgi:hypothetical protein
MGWVALRLAQTANDFYYLCSFDILAAVKRTAIPHHATFLEWSLNGVDATWDAASLTGSSVIVMQIINLK